MKNHVVIDPGPGEMGYGCKCGVKRFPTRKDVTAHAEVQNQIEENEAKAAESAKAKAAELERQAKVAASTLR